MATKEKEAQPKPAKAGTESTEATPERAKTAPATPAPEPIQAAISTVTPQQQAEIDEGQWFSSRQIANKLGFSLVWVSILLKQGRIKGVKILGGQWRIPKSEYDRLTKEGLPPVPRKKPAEVREIEVAQDKLAKVAPPKKEKQGKDEGGYFPFDFRKLFG